VAAGRRRKIKGKIAIPRRSGAREKDGWKQQGKEERQKRMNYTGGRAEKGEQRDEETAEGARQLVFYTSRADLISSATPSGSQPGHEEPR